MVRAGLISDVLTPVAGLGVVPQIVRSPAENGRLGTLRLRISRRWMNRYLIAHGQPLTTKRPSSRIRHSTSRLGTSAPSIDASYRFVR